jgi:glutathione S-transferase
LSQNSQIFPGNKPSIADLSAYEELEQLKLLSYDFSSYDKISAWMAKIKSLEYYEEVHDMLNRLNAKVQAEKAEKK